MCENYLISNHKNDLYQILEHPEKDKFFSVHINFLELFESDTNLGHALLTDPEESLKLWDEAVFNVQNNLIKIIDKKWTIKNNVSCRIYSLPPWPHVCRTIFPGNEDSNKFLQVSGTVIRMSARKLLEFQRQYVCTKCKYPITVVATYDKRNIIKQPKKCTNPDGCTSKTIITFGELDPYNCKDYQEIKIQEDLSKLGVGSVPNTMIVTLEDDLVNVCKPGENVTITGIVKRRWSEFEKGVKIVVDIVLRANHVQVNNSSGLSMVVSEDMRQFFNSFWNKYHEESLLGRSIILKSIAPELYGLNVIKLAIAVVLAGGSRTEESLVSTGIDTRSESHLLLVGDPGTGKSQLLRFASKIIPRSVLTTGVGSTAAGLTVTAVMESGEWQLEAGALVMADGGICCIDEFNSMREHDRTSIHEAMEQQTISVAKAGMVCKLKTRCSILAACNPKGNIDPSQPLCMNVAMSSPLLSRFDLILLIRDVVNEENDRKLAEYQLNKTGDSGGEGSEWCLKKLQSYYVAIKGLNPKLTSEAETILSTYYQLQRKFGSRNKSRTTVRLLESLIRLSQGHAKLMFHLEVEVIDTIFAIILVDAALDYESSLFNLKLDNNAFCDEPGQLYKHYLENILQKLNLDYILNKEINKTNNRSNKSSPTNSTNTSQNQGDVSHLPSTQNFENLPQSVQTSTPNKPRFLFSQRRQPTQNQIKPLDESSSDQRQNTSEGDSVCRDQNSSSINANSCLNNESDSRHSDQQNSLNAHSNSLGRPTFLFSQKRRIEDQQLSTTQSIRQELSEKKTLSENFSNDGNNKDVGVRIDQRYIQNANTSISDFPKFLFSQKRRTIKQPALSNQSTRDELPEKELEQKSSKKFNSSSNDSGHISSQNSNSIQQKLDESLLDQTNLPTDTKLRSNFVPTNKDIFPEPKFSNIQNKNDTLLKNKVPLNFEKLSSSRQTQKSKKLFGRSKNFSSDTIKTLDNMDFDFDGLLKDMFNNSDKKVPEKLKKVPVVKDNKVCFKESMNHSEKKNDDEESGFVSQNISTEKADQSGKDSQLLIVKKHRSRVDMKSQSVNDCFVNINYNNTQNITVNQSSTSVIQNDQNTSSISKPSQSKISDEVSEKSSKESTSDSDLNISQEIKSTNEVKKVNRTLQNIFSFGSDDFQFEDCPKETNLKPETKITSCSQGLLVNQKCTDKHKSQTHLDCTITTGPKTDEPSTSRDTEWSKKWCEEKENKHLNIHDNTVLKKQFSEAFKDLNDIDFDFDIPIKNLNAFKKSDNVKSCIEKESDMKNMRELSKKSEVTNIVNHPYKIPSEKTNQNPENQMDKGKKRHLKSPAKSSKKTRKDKTEITNESDMMKLMPSVNDDFMDVGIGFDIDFDVEKFNDRDSGQSNIRFNSEDCFKNRNIGPENIKANHLEKEPRLTNNGNNSINSCKNILENMEEKDVECEIQSSQNITTPKSNNNNEKCDSKQNFQINKLSDPVENLQTDNATNLNSRFLDNFGDNSSKKSPKKFTFKRTKAAKLPSFFENKFLESPGKNSCIKNDLLGNAKTLNLKRLNSMLDFSELDDVNIGKGFCNSEANTKSNVVNQNEHNSNRIHWDNKTSNDFNNSNDVELNKKTIESVSKEIFISNNQVESSNFKREQNVLHEGSLKSFKDFLHTKFGFKKRNDDS